MQSISVVLFALRILGTNASPVEVQKLVDHHHHHHDSQWMTSTTSSEATTSTSTMTPVVNYDQTPTSSATSINTTTPVVGYNPTTTPSNSPTGYGQTVSTTTEESIIIFPMETIVEDVPFQSSTETTTDGSLEQWAFLSFFDKRSVSNDSVEACTNGTCLNNGTNSTDSENQTKTNWSSSSESIEKCQTGNGCIVKKGFTTNLPPTMNPNLSSTTTMGSMSIIEKRSNSNSTSTTDSTSLEDYVIL